MVANPESEKNVENPGKKQSWWLTLPGFFTATAALLAAIGGLITGIHLFFNGTSPSTITEPGTTSPPPTQVTTMPPPKSVTTISLPGLADWQGWLDNPAARCGAKDYAVAIGRTDQGTKVVVCCAGPGDLYYMAVDSNGDAIELWGAKRIEGGFDVTTQVDGNIFQRQIRNDKFTMLEDGRVIRSEQWRDYAQS